MIASTHEGLTALESHMHEGFLLIDGVVRDDSGRAASVRIILY